MNEKLGFDDSAARRVERIYSTPDVVQQRERTLDFLGLQSGERVLDIGVGPGYLAREMAQRVGSRGKVDGVDLSEPMLSLARVRCEDLPWVSMHKADALDLPFDNGEFDVAVSTQVYEYVADMDGALAELHRVLSPGGRALIVDTDWDSIVLHSDEPELTRQILTVWDEHLVDPHLPRRLRSMLRRAGFRPGATSAIPIVNTEYDVNTYSHGMLGLISSFVSGRSGVEEEDVERWHAGIVALAERGEYFVSVNRYLFVAEKPEY